MAPRPGPAPTPVEWLRLPDSSAHSDGETTTSSPLSEVELGARRDDDDGDGDDEGGAKTTSTSAPAAAGAATGNTLRKELRFVDALGVVVGIMVGSGVFSSPGVALRNVDGSAALCLSAWASSGALVATTATCYFELHALLPSAGGDFAYLKEAYGDRAAFSFAWFNLLISKTGSQAIISTIFGRYAEQVILHLFSADPGSTSSAEQETSLSKGLALALVVCSTALNCYSVQSSTSLQNALTVVKMVCVFGLFVAAVAVAAAHPSATDNNALSHSSSSSSSSSQSGWGGFGSSMVACLWSFDGWCDVVFMTEELRSPASLPRIVLTAIGSVTVLYLAVNFAYLLLLPSDVMQSSRAIGMAFGDRLAAASSSSPSSSSSSSASSAFSPACFIAAVVVVSTMSSANGSIMTGARAFFAVARDGKFPAPMAAISAAGSPYVSLLVQGAWTVLLLLLPGSGFSSLLDYFGPCSWFFYAFSASAVIALRERAAPSISSSPSSSSFRVPWYPLPPVAVAVVAACIIVSSLARSPLYTALAFAVVALSVPFHIAFLEMRPGSGPGSGPGPGEEGGEAAGEGEGVGKGPA